MRVPVMIGLLLLAPASDADSQTELQIRNSYLALSAFECAVVSVDDKERERLFMLGLKAGRDFIEYAQAHKDSYMKDFKPKVAILWNMTGGPTTDFVLGQIYADREHDIYKEYSTDDQLWKMKKQNMYRDKNCALLGK